MKEYTAYRKMLSGEIVEMELKIPEDKFLKWKGVIFEEYGNGLIIDQELTENEKEFARKIARNER